MKLLINTEIIKKLNPCNSRFDNWKKHYGKKTYSVSNFLRLKKITHEDKLWVALRLAPKIVVETFAIDCAVAATSTADAADHAAACAANVAAAACTAYAADCAALVTVSHDTERLRQLEALEYLIRTHEEGT